MNKSVVMKVLSVVAILITIYITVIWQPSTNSERNIKEEDTINKIINENIENEKLAKEKKEVSDNKKFTDNEDLVIKKEQEEHDKDDESEILFENIKAEEEENTLEKENRVEKIISDLNDEEKELFKVVINKLSVTDINTIEKMLKTNENGYGITKVLEFLEIRLIEEDYSKVQNLFIEEADMIENVDIEY